MDILICGSAAAEGIPALFCSCETCQRARERGGKDLRTRTAYQFGEAVRVDFGPDALAHSLRFNLRYERLLHLFITHSHEDHLYPLDFQYRQPGFSVVPEGDLLTLYGNAAAMAAVSGKIDANPKRFRLALVELRPFVEQAAGNTGLSFTPLPANHAQTEECFIYLVREAAGKTLLIANDTGIFPEATWKFLEGCQIDGAIIDCTTGRDNCRDNHLGVQGVLDTVARLTECRGAKPGAVFVANHFSHNGQMNHADLEAFFAASGVRTGYDGLALQM